MSCTVTENCFVLVLPRASLAEHPMLLVPSANVDPDAGKQFTGTDPSTTSLAVGDVQVAIAPLGAVASRIKFDGKPLMTGGVVSRTMTVNLPLLLLPCPSVAEQLTVVDPSGNTEPDDGAQITATVPSTRSFAVGPDHVTTAPDAEVASAVMLDGRLLINGGVVSFTVTTNDPAAVLPAASVALHCTVTLPTANCDPDAGVHSTGTVPSTLSVAVTPGQETVVVSPVASSWMSTKPLITGRVSSATVSGKLWDAMLPALSLAVQVTVVVPSGNILPDAGKQLGTIAPSTMSSAVAM